MNQKVEFKHRVAIMEYERGWGSKVESIKSFKTIAAAKKYCEKFNSVNDKPQAPDWYMVAKLIED